METVRLVQRRGARIATYEILPDGLRVIEESPHRGDDVTIPWLQITGQRIRTTRYPRTWLGVLGVSASLTLVLVVGALSGEEEASVTALATWLGLALASGIVVLRGWRREIVLPALPRPIVLDASRPSGADVRRFLDACEAQRQAWRDAEARSESLAQEAAELARAASRARAAGDVVRAAGATDSDDEVH